jgi:hypothetical protein
VYSRRGANQALRERPGASQAATSTTVRPGKAVGYSQTLRRNWFHVGHAGPRKILPVRAGTRSSAEPVDVKPGRDRARADVIRGETSIETAGAEVGVITCSIRLFLNASATPGHRGFDVDLDLQDDVIDDVLIPLDAVNFACTNGLE